MTKIFFVCLFSYINLDVEQQTVVDLVDNDKKINNEQHKWHS